MDANPKQPEVGYESLREAGYLGRDRDSKATSRVYKEDPSLYNAIPNN